MGYRVGLVGESNFRTAIRSARGGQRVLVLHEKGNPYDELALVVKTAAGDTLGYVAKDCWLRDAIHDEGKGCAASIASINSGTLGVVIEVTLNPDGVETCSYAR